MATIKAYTDLKQSKKLAEFLPHESADMAWCNNSIKRVNYTDEYSANLYTVEEMRNVFDKALVGWDKYWKLIPCWSLQALLDEIPYTIMNKQEEDLKLHIEKDNLQYYLFYENEYNGDMFEIETDMHDNMIDACVEMIITLFEQNLI